MKSRRRCGRALISAQFWIVAPRRRVRHSGSCEQDLRQVDGIGLAALDLGLRGAAAGLFLMMVAVLLRPRPLTTIGWLGAAMSAGGRPI